MKRALCVLAVVAGVSLSQCGCRTTLLESYAPPKSGRCQSTEKILGLPPLAGGIQISAPFRQNLELELDKVLAERWGAQYVPLSQGKQSCQALLAKWTTQMSCDYDLAARLRVNASLCQDLAQASGCRYAILPTVGRCNSDAANILNVTYVIPAGLVIIVGNVPIFLGKYQANDMSVCTMTLLDLKEGAVISEAAMASRDKMSESGAAYPGALINAIGRSAKIKQRKI
ncbi:MAG: hypothetical protein WCO77_05460 [bacterium]